MNTISPGDLPYLMFLLFVVSGLAVNMLVSAGGAYIALTIYHRRHRAS